MNDTDDRADEEYNKLEVMIIEIISSNKDDHKILMAMMILTVMLVVKPCRQDQF